MDNPGAGSRGADGGGEGDGRGAVSPGDKGDAKSGAINDGGVQASELAALRALLEQQRSNQLQLQAQLADLIKAAGRDDAGKSAGADSKRSSKQQAKPVEAKPESRGQRKKVDSRAAVLAAVEAAVQKEELDSKEMRDLEDGLGDLGLEAADGDSDYEEEDASRSKLPPHLRFGPSDDEGSDEESVEGDAKAGGGAKASAAASAGEELPASEKTYRRCLKAILHGGQTAAVWVTRVIPSSAKGGYLHERAMLSAQLFGFANQRVPDIRAIKRLCVKSMVACWMAHEHGSYSMLDELTTSPLIPLDNDEILAVARHEYSVQKYKKKKVPAQHQGGGQPQVQQQRAASTYNANAKKGKGKQSKGPGAQ